MIWQKPLVDCQVKAIVVPFADLVMSPVSGLNRGLAEIVSQAVKARVAIITPAANSGQFGKCG